MTNAFICPHGSEEIIEDIDNTGSPLPPFDMKIRTGDI
jgi:hypothetical protein